MAVPSNTYLRYTSIGVREDLSNVIYDISPTDTPIMSSIGKTKATNTLHEWQTDSLAAATTNNALIEGDDATAASLSPTVRLTNFTQIVGKTVQISGTLEAVDKAGRKSEKAYQLAKASAEIKRDIETILTANQAKTNGTAPLALVRWVRCCRGLRLTSAKVRLVRTRRATVRIFVPTPQPARSWSPCFRLLLRKSSAMVAHPSSWLFLPA